MLYFSELKGKKIFTEDNILVGRLEDLIFLVAETPLITKLVIRSVFKERLVVSTSFLKNLNGNIIIAKEYITTDLEENELYIMKNLLDKQIIDLKGNKIVRVNDIIIQEKGTLYVSGVDIGLLGIVRWFGIEKLLNKIFSYFRFQLSSKFLSWGDIQPLELVQGKVKLKKKEDKMKKIRPEDLADYLEETNVVNARKFLGILDDTKAADVISSLNINYQTALFKHFSPEKAAKFVVLVDPDDAVDVLLTLSSKKREMILNCVTSEKKHEIIRLLNLAKNPIGNLVTTQFCVVRSDETVRITEQKIKKTTQDYPSLIYIYVVNELNQLVGVISLHELLIHDLDEQIYKFMTQNVIVTHLTTPKEIVLKRMIKYSLQTIPVINDDKQILGIINFDDIAELLLSKY
jgi:magnesium transporter